ncbi:MAG: ATP-grasp domain-containing protein [Ruminiclostridium sp.]|nr:ATP-grasp domain-containing protein [Ruminiclostridium sp.]
MENLLVLNGSHSDIPLIKAGKKLGFRVITTGNRPDLIGHRYADEYICCDFSDPVAVYNTFKDRHISAVCSCANDFGAITAAFLAEKLGLPGHDTYENALTIHHKDRFKRFAADIGLHTPKAVSFSELSGAIAFEPESYPFMVKPIDLTGGKGVSKVYDRGEYEAAVKLAFDLSPSGRIVAEPFIEGTQHSFSTFLIGGRVRAYFSDNEYSYLNKFLVSTSAGPATKVDCAKDILISDAEKTAKALDLKDGVFHYQYILSENNEPFILEITRRCSGDIYPEPVEHATGIKWAENIVRAE